MYSDETTYAVRTWQTVWHEGKNRNNKVIYKVTARISSLGEQSPAFHVTYEESDNYSRRRNDLRACGSGGYEMIQRIKHLRDTAHLAHCEHFYHGFHTDRGQWHYAANGLYWYDVASGKYEQRSYDPNPFDAFNNTIAYGLLPMDSRFHPFDMPREVLAKWLQARQSALLVAFRRDMEALFNVPFGRNNLPIR